MLVRYASFYYPHDSKTLKDQIQSISYKSEELELLANRQEEVDTDKVIEIEQKQLVLWLQQYNPKKVVLDLRENRGGSLNVQLINGSSPKNLRS